MDKLKLLVQLDTDPQPSLFDRVVAFDAGADHVLSYGNVQVEQVRSLVHGAIFTRSFPDLKRTALFVGGSDVTAGERLLAEVRRQMIPQYGLRVSVLFDANGANTTAAAAVQAIARHLPLPGLPVVVLGGTGPVGQRIALLLAAQKADVRVGAVDHPGAARLVQVVTERVPGAAVAWTAIDAPGGMAAALADRQVVVSAAAPGVRVLSRAARAACTDLKFAVDVNAVPPSGIEGVETADKGALRDGLICYGALGVGGAKMKIHRAAIARLFESNDQILDAEEVYALAQQI
jgi:hypothetical protein